MRKLVEYKSFKFEISTIPSLWKSYRVWFVDLPSREAPGYGWNEHEVIEYAKWVIDNFGEPHQPYKIAINHAALRVLV